MKITVQIGKIILESLSHIDGIISARDFTVDAFHAVHQFHPFLRPQDEDDGRHHVAEHAGMGTEPSMMMESLMTPDRAG